MKNNTFSMFTLISCNIENIENFKNIESAEKKAKANFTVEESDNSNFGDTDDTAKQ